MNCHDCRFLKVYRGSRDRYGLQMEPDDYECTSSRATEDNLDRYFCDAEDGAEKCMGFEEKEEYNE
jgi:hypothetical protein